MQIIKGKEQEYADWKAKNDDPYGGACFVWAETWANLMEVRISNGDEIVAMAEETSHESSKGEGYTGFMYGMAVSILSECWIHGEELRRWSNLDIQIGDEGERANEEGGVLNPALLNIG